MLYFFSSLADILKAITLSSTKKPNFNNTIILRNVLVYGFLSLAKISDSPTKVLQMDLFYSVNINVNVKAMASQSVKANGNVNDFVNDLVNVNVKVSTNVYIFRLVNVFLIKFVHISIQMSI